MRAVSWWSFLRLFLRRHSPLLSTITSTSDSHHVWTAPVIVFCRSGRRAGKAKEMLEAKGYTKVLNAGGLTGLDYL
jgi:phage shock protein E